MPAPFVQLDHVRVSLAGRPVLRNLNWRWRAGESWAVLGANGSGKSTFLRLVAAELHPDPVAGGQRTYALDGVPTPSAIGVRERMAFVSPEQQERYLNLEWVRTGRDVLLTGFHQTDYLLQRLTAEQRASAAQLAAELRLGPLLRRDVQTLSHGELRRVLIARALLGRPRWLLLDEFTDGLDRATRTGLLAAVRRAVAAGTHVLMATHRAEEVVPGIRRRLELVDGQVVTARSARRAVPQVDPNPLAAGNERGDESPRGHSERKRADSSRQSSAITSQTADTPFLFRLRQASVYLDRQPVLRRMDWIMRPGEHWAVTGPNGAGKSTFLKLLLGELHPAVGGAIARFNEARRHTLWEIRARVGYVGPDLQTAYRDDLTTRAVIASGYFASIGLLDDVTLAQWRRVDALLAQFGLTELAHAPFLRLSYGQRRRVLLARAVVHAPQVLLLDEPLDGLDTASLTAMRGHLAELTRTGTSLVVVTHRPEDLAGIPLRELGLRK